MNNFIAMKVIKLLVLVERNKSIISIIQNKIKI